MKHLGTLIIAAMLCCGCGTTLWSLQTTSLVGNITTYSMTGEVLKVYENVLIEEETRKVSDESGFSSRESSYNSVKSWGINFWYEPEKTFVIISNSTPYTITYEVKQKSEKLYDINGNEVLSPEDEWKKASQLEREYWSLATQIKTAKKKLREIGRKNKEGEEYKEQEKQLKSLQDEQGKKLREWQRITGEEFFI